MVVLRCENENMEWFVTRQKLTDTSDFYYVSVLEPEEDLPYRVSSVTKEIWEHSYGLE